MRKQFHPPVKKQAYEKEVRNLSILSSVRHQNIIPLLSAYTHGESLNLIFPLVSHGSLDQLFRDGSPSSLGSQASVVMAVWGLASALGTIHGFTLGSLHLAGSHRDLKPANILVNDGQWLLADFGLSRIVEDQDSSSSIAPAVPGDFIAPEHEDRDFERNLIGRASDIFSFGCMILMLLMFYLDGSQGLERLKTKRRRADAQYTHHFFHDYDKPNAGMPEIFDYLACKTSPLSPSLLFLIRKMLEIDKELRPKAAAVDNYLRSLATHMWSTSIEEGLSKACQSGDTHIPILVEKIRFQGWCSAAKIKDWESPAFSEAFASVSERDFRTILDDMQELHRLLTGSETRVRKTFDPIRARIDRLLNALDDDRRTSAVGYADCILLGSTEHLWLSQLQKFSAEALDSRTKDKVITRRRVLDLSAAPQKFSNNLQIPLSALESLPPRGTASKVRLRSKQVRETVLAEECSAIAVRRWSHGVPVRLQETAELLAASAKNHSFRVLCCRGYYYDNPKLRSGLLYELPSSPQDSIPEVVTLRELLQNNNSQWLLGDRFRLAHGLALALFELHTVSWFHRNISASNVIFFYYEHINNIDPRSFHFVGFAQSRPDRDSTESDGVTQDSGNEDHYVHPEYLYQDQGFQAQYDYYAFGILLLEIAFWQLFFEFAPDTPSSCDSSRFTKVDVTKLLPKLGMLMGQSYRDSVLACLDGTISAEASSVEGLSLPLRFREAVVDRLSPKQCLVW